MAWGGGASLPEGMTLRRARIGDARHIGDLARELAGPMTDEQARRRFLRFVLGPSYLVFVVEDSADDGRLVGLWFGREGHFLGADLPYVQTLGLAVVPDQRRRGIASHLMVVCPPDSHHSQNWFTTQHPHLHDLYEGLGFAVSGTRFVRYPEHRAPLPRHRRALRSLTRRLGR
ncbi:MAG: GNAT family N-acetyltransferase [Actinomycetota bacterium]